MRKIIKRHGNSLCIVFDVNDKEVYKIKEGDFIDFNIGRITENKEIIRLEKGTEARTNVKAIIIAAGKGSRLNPLTVDKPKCMLEIAGKTVLQRAIDCLRENGINNIAVVKGYKKEKINYPGLKYYVNDNYENNNILHSLFYAEPEMDGDFIALYSDILFKKDVVKKLLEHNHDFSVIVDKNWIKAYEGRTNHPTSEAEKVIIENGKIVEIGKHLTVEESHGEFIGMVKFSDEGTEILKNVFNDAKKKFTGKPFQCAKVFEKAYLTDMIQELIDNGHDVHPVVIEGKWHEMDTLQDFEKLVTNYRL